LDINITFIDIIITAILASWVVGYSLQAAPSVHWLLALGLAAVAVRFASWARE